MARSFELLETRYLLAATLFKDINPRSTATTDGSNISSNPRDFHQLGDITLFVADSELGTELWRSDGTSGGTSVLKDITPGSDGTDFYRFALTDRFLFFETSGLGNRLWRTDGTVQGTVLLGRGTRFRAAQTWTAALTLVISSSVA